MARKRWFLRSILVILTTFVLTWGNPAVAAKAPATYSPAQLEQIQEYAPRIVAIRERMGELQRLIKTRDWIDVSNFIHGPLGELRLDMTYLTRNLLAKDQPAARQATRELFNHLVSIDKAAEIGNYQRAMSYYQAASADIDNFLQLVPPLPSQSEQTE
jgi:photosystem II protein PsbQ